MPLAPRRYLMPEILRQSDTGEEYDSDLTSTADLKDQSSKHAEISMVLPYFLTAYRIATNYRGLPPDGPITVREDRRRGRQAPPHFYVRGDMHLNDESGHRETTPGLFVQGAQNQMLDGDELRFHAPPDGLRATRHHKYVMRLERSDNGTNVAWWKFVQVDAEELHGRGAVVALYPSSPVIRHPVERSLAKRSGYQACRERAIQAGMALTRTSRYG